MPTIILSGTIEGIQPEAVYKDVVYTQTVSISTVDGEELTVFDSVPMCISEDDIGTTASMKLSNSVTDPIERAPVATVGFHAPTERIDIWSYDVVGDIPERDLETQRRTLELNRSTLELSTETIDAYSEEVLIRPGDRVRVPCYQLTLDSITEK